MEISKDNLYLELSNFLKKKFLFLLFILLEIVAIQEMDV